MKKKSLKPKHDNKKNSEEQSKLKGGLVSAAKEILNNPLYKPFKYIADRKNPFSIGNDFDRAINFSQLVIDLLQFAEDCTDARLWILADKETTDKNRNMLQEKKDAIKTLLEEIMPTGAKKQVADQYIRIFKYFPKILVKTVDHIWSQLNQHYDRIKKDKSFRFEANDEKREQAVANYLKEDLEDLFELHIYLNQICPTIGLKPPWNKKTLLKTISVSNVYNQGDAYSYVAIRILSHLFKCSYDRLYDIYYKGRKQLKNQNVTSALSTPPK